MNVPPSFGLTIERTLRGRRIPRASIGPRRNLISKKRKDVMAELDMEKLRVLAAELGYWPATTDDEHITELRRQNAHYGVLFAQDPDGTKWQKMAGTQRRTAGEDEQ
jgi:hypothetical protein